jgi:hypothetical protein
MGNETSSRADHRHHVEQRSARGSEAEVGVNPRRRRLLHHAVLAGQSCCASPERRSNRLPVSSQARTATPPMPLALIYFGGFRGFRSRHRVCCSSVLNPC